MDMLTNDIWSRIRSDTLNVSSSLPRTDMFNVSDLKAAGRKDADTLYTQFYTFVKELTQVLEGDLRIKLTVPEGNMGALAEICNALIEKLILFSRWTLYSAEQTVSTSQVLLNQAFTQAQAAEDQIRQIANVVGTLEGVIASTQRLNCSLRLSAAIGREQESYFLQQNIALENMIEQSSGEEILDLMKIIENENDMEYKRSNGKTKERREQLSSNRNQDESTADSGTMSASHLLAQLMTNTQKQVHTLEETSHALSENVEASEVGIRDLYTITQSLYTSSVQILQTTRHISGLIEAAEDWKHSIEELRLPEEEQEEAGAEWLL
jgi:hypothetical protein